MTTTIADGKYETLVKLEQLARRAQQISDDARRLDDDIGELMCEFAGFTAGDEERCCEVLQRVAADVDR